MSEMKRALVSESIKLAQRTLQLKGPDAADFLHRVCSQDVKNMPTSSMAFAGLLDRKGNILGLFQIWRLEAHNFLLLMDPEDFTPIQTALEFFLFQEDLRLNEAKFCNLQLEVTWPARWDFENFKTFSRLQSSELFYPLEKVDLGEANVHQYRAHAQRFGAYASLLLTIVLPENSEIRPAFAAEYTSNPSSEEQQRAHFFFLACGVGSQGPEKHRGLFLEQNLEDCLVRNKGCYPGQEIIERVYAKGNIQKTMVLLGWKLTGADLEKFQTALTTAQDLIEPEKLQAVGTVLSSKKVPEDLQDCFAPYTHLSLALVRREFWQKDQELLLTSAELGLKGQVLFNRYSKK